MGAKLKAPNGAPVIARHPLKAVATLVSPGARALPLSRAGGLVSEVAPGYARVGGLSKLLKLGDCVELDTGGAPRLCEVVRVDETGATVKAFDVSVNAGLGTRAWRRGPLTIAPHPGWKGRIIDALAAPIDAMGPLAPGDITLPLDRESPAPMRRQRVNEPLRTGIRAIDLFTPLCAGQRIGIFAGSGVGKSTLLGMLARATSFDTTVVALVGERGREVREFVDDVLGDALYKSICVVATGDESAMMRRLAPKTAIAIAESLRNLGESVLLIVDSLTRFAHAARDVALAAGELPVARGYAPSVFSELPKLLERAGPGEDGGGSITGIFSVLVDGDDQNDPVADAVRGMLDGHIVLDRAIADAGRYPAINPLSSVSRLARHAWTGDERALVLKLRAMISRFEETRDLRLMGGYRDGTDPDLDNAVAIVPKIYEALRQDPDEPLSADAFHDIARALSG